MIVSAAAETTLLTPDKERLKSSQSVFAKELTQEKLCPHWLYISANSHLVCKNSFYKPHPTLIIALFIIQN